MPNTTLWYCAPITYYGRLLQHRQVLGPNVVPSNSQQKPSTAATSLESAGSNPIVWQAHFSMDITDQLISWGNPKFQVNNSDLELAVSVIHHTCMEDCFDIRVRTTLSRIYNTAGLWWNIKGSATPTLPPDHLLCIQTIHQWFHRYIPCHNFLIGENGISD